MKNKYVQYKAEWEFSKEVRSKLIPPGQCRTIRQITKCMEDLHFLIGELKVKYDFTPDAASVLFEKYSSMHEKMIYEKFIKEDSF